MFNKTFIDSFAKIKEPEDAIRDTKSASLNKADLMKSLKSMD